MKRKRFQKLNFQQHRQPQVYRQLQRCFRHMLHQRIQHFPNFLQSRLVHLFRLLDNHHTHLVRQIQQRWKFRNFQLETLYLSQLHIVD